MKNKQKLMNSQKENAELKKKVAILNRNRITQQADSLIVSENSMLKD